MLTLMFALACSTPTVPETTAASEPTEKPAPSARSEKHNEAGQYVCPMHPDVVSSEPGECSKCGMALVESDEHDHNSHDHANGEHGEAGHDDHRGH